MMKTLSPDTSQKAEQVLIDLIRKAPFYKRIEMVNSLIKVTRRLSWRAICERYPDETEEKRIQRFVALLYGDESLAKRVAELAVKKLR
jgi:hypothetical protein